MDFFMAFFSAVAAAASCWSAFIARKVVIDLERPYLFVACDKHVHQDRSQKYDGNVYIKCTVTNHGKVPAIIKDIAISTEPLNNGKPVLGLTDRSLLSQVIDPGEKVIIPTCPKKATCQTVTDIDQKNPYYFDQDIFFHAVTTYSSPFSTKLYTTKSTWRFDNRHRCFVACCDDQKDYNYRT